MYAYMPIAIYTLINIIMYNSCQYDRCYMHPIRLSNVSSYYRAILYIREHFKSAQLDVYVYLLSN